MGFANADKALAMKLHTKRDSLPSSHTPVSPPSAGRTKTFTPRDFSKSKGLNASLSTSSKRDMMRVLIVGMNDIVANPIEQPCSTTDEVTDDLTSLDDGISQDVPVKVTLATPASPRRRRHFASRDGSFHRSQASSLRVVQTDGPRRDSPRNPRRSKYILQLTVTGEKDCSSSMTLVTATVAAHKAGPAKAMSTSISLLDPLGSTSEHRLLPGLSDIYPTKTRDKRAPDVSPQEPCYLQLTFPSPGEEVTELKANVVGIAMSRASQGDLATQKTPSSPFRSNDTSSDMDRQAQRSPRPASRRSSRANRHRNH